MFKLPIWTGLLAWLLAGLTASAALAGQATNVQLSDGTDMSVVHYPAQGSAAANTAVLWLPSEHGLPSGLGKVAQQLSQQGVDVWVADPYTTWFLPVAESSLKKFQRGPLAALVAQLHQKTGKRLVVISSDHGSRVALQVVRQAQQQNHAAGLAGVILISPNVYAQTPQPGQPGRFAPIAAATNVPVFLMVPDQSTLHLRMMAIAEELGRGGSRIYVQALPDVRDRFFFRPDAVSAEDTEARQLPVQIRQAMGLLQQEKVPGQAVALKQSGPTTPQGQTQTLEPYTGSLTPPAFNRVDLHGQRHTLGEYRGKVVLLNFWAGWCPPCVHEMPSMVRLQKHFSGQPFQILAVNLGQSRTEVEHFLKDTPVNFPVFLDPGMTEPKRWRVFAFPTSYLIDAHGKIRYGVAGGLEWDGKQAEATVAKLIAETEGADASK